jgi:hypothetical protein
LRTCTASGQRSLKPHPLKQSSSISQLAVTLHRVAAFCFAHSPLFEIARVLARFDHATEKK